MNGEAESSICMVINTVMNYVRAPEQDKYAMAELNVKEVPAELSHGPMESRLARDTHNRELSK